MTVDQECRLDIGGAVIALECPSADYAASMRAYFGLAGPAAGEPHLRLALELEDHEDWPEIPSSLFTTKRTFTGGFEIADGLVRGDFDPATGRGTLRVKYALTKADLTRVFEQLLYQAFYSARRASGHDSFLIHSSGVIRGGDGFLFVGASEAGKTTVADLSAHHQVVNDEICLIEFTPEGALLHGTPFNGHFPRKSPGSAPLRAILLLAQGAVHELADTDRGPAVAALAGQIVPPVGLADQLDGKVRLEMLELADRLGAAAPVRRLSFRKDDGFWQVLDDAFPPLATS